jgi:hypothetical protein
MTSLPICAERASEGASLEVNGLIRHAQIGTRTRLTSRPPDISCSPDGAVGPDGAPQSDAAVVNMDAATPRDAAHGPSLDATSAGAVDAGNAEAVDAWVQGARDAGSETDIVVAPVRDVFGVTALLSTAPGGLEWDSRYWEVTIRRSLRGSV